MFCKDAEFKSLLTGKCYQHMVMKIVLKISSVT